MAPNNAQSSAFEITPHGAVTYHAEFPEKAQTLPGRSVIPVSSSNRIDMLDFCTDKRGSETDQRKWTWLDHPMLVMIVL
jgi:hypothetical protein